MVVSKINGKEYKNLRALSVHLLNHSMSVLEYYIKYEGLTIPKCKYCESDAKYIQSFKFRQTCGSKECVIKGVHERSRSEPFREIQRRKRFEFLSDPKNFYKTAWGKSAQRKMTYGEEQLHTRLSDAGVYENFDVVFQYPVYPYCIDFAFINEKVGLEFDGKCHFRSNARIEHDIKRDSKLSELGWRIYRVSYLEIDEFKVSDLLEFIGCPEKKQTLTRTLIINTKKKKSPIFQNGRKIRTFSHKTLEKFKRRKDAQFELAKYVEASDIDFSKYGWVNHVSKLINKSPAHINKWMKEFMPDFYKSKCFKRKPRQIPNPT